MPTYTFIDKDTQEVFDVIMSISDYSEYLKEHPHHERHFDQAPVMISGSSTSLKHADGFNEVLSKIAEAHPNSELADRHHRKTIKQARTERVIKEWKKRNS